MNYEEHLAAAQDFLDAESILTRRGMDRAAAEMVWGAAVEAIDAANHRRAPRHLSHSGRLATVNRLQEKYGLAPQLSDGFNTARGSLHNHFYTGRLTELETIAEIAVGRRFVSAMIDIARREHAEQDAP